MPSSVPHPENCSANVCSLLFLHASWSSQSSLPYPLLGHRVWLSEGPRAGN